MLKRSYRVAVDVGGTFTDLIAEGDDGELIRAKVPTTYPDFQRGVLEAVRAAKIPFTDFSLFLHGTTLATNAVIARNGAKTGLVATEGFRDLIEIRRANRPREGMYDVAWNPAPPLVPRRNRLTVVERVDYLGRVVTPLDEDEARIIGRAFRKRGIESIAVSFLNAFLCPNNEQAMARILREECPGVFITLSSDIIPVILEFERTSTTVVNAYVEPIVRRYMKNLRDDFQSEGYEGEILVMQSSGGVTTAEGAGEGAARTIMSGPAAGVIAVQTLGEEIGIEDLIGFDMGGTSADIATIHGGQVRITQESDIDFGIPVLLPTIDIATIGAGGGTIAWIDDGGILKSGPQSAGSTPGPACYGGGGTAATNTDANLVLGVLDPTGFAGGSMDLHVDLAQAAVGKLGDQLGLDPVRTASGIIQVSNGNMVQAIRQVTTERGYDPRHFSLVAFGGAGPLHCADLAAQMSIPRVVVPPDPGLTSALGLLFTDVRCDFTKTFHRRTDQLRCKDVEKEFAALESKARSRLRASNFENSQIRIERIAQLKYYGGFEAVALPITIVGETFDQTALDDMLARFATEHDREYNYSLDDVPLEIQLVQVVAYGLIDRPERRSTGRLSVSDGDIEAALTNEREVFFHESDDFLKTHIYDRNLLTAGAHVRGPAIVEQMDSTVLIRPTMSAVVDEFGNLIVDTVGARV